MKNDKKKFFAELKRKFFVALKKNPQSIPLLAHTVAFLIFSLNLTSISNTTAKIYGAHMGLCAFVAMLFSILAYVCLFSAYPKRQKPNISMIIVILVLYACIIFADVCYFGRINEALNRAVSPIKPTSYIKTAKTVMITHIISLIISAALIVIEPVYAKLFKKINTSIDIEDNGELGAIELSDGE